MAGKIQAFTSPARGVLKFKEIIVRDLVSVEDAATMSREQNVAGLSSAITMANEARLDMISHFANTTRHATGEQSTTGIAPVATGLASLITLTTSLMALYVIHHTDSRLASGHDWHDGQGDDHSLSNEVAPVNLQETVTKLIDFRAKWNDHEAGAAAHTGGTETGDEINAGAPAYGAANLVPVTGCSTGDRVFWSILNDGTGNVTGVSAVAGDTGVTFTFSADPQNDAIISYMVARSAA